MKRFLGIFFLFSVCCVTQVAAYTIQGRVQNKDNGELLEMAAVRLFSYSGTDSTLVTGAQTDPNGVFTLSAGPGRYGVLVSMLGFTEKKVLVTVTVADVRMRPVLLEEQAEMLRELEVRGAAVEMTVKGDTLEYNASAYKVTENAVVEDLLKKMSGVEISSDGSVTVNGEEIKGIRIDGKKFFGNDVQTATKNIPADMIDKIQVVDQKSDMAKLTGIEDDDTERIINLTLKQDKKKGMFGNFTGALGSDMVDWQDPWVEEDFRYNASAFMNLLLGESQTTIVAGANNTNEARSGRGRGWQGGGSRSGITRAENLGVNTNVLLSDKWTFGGDASLNHTSNHTEADSRKEQYGQDYTYLNGDTTRSNAQGWDANMRLEFELKADTLNTLLLKPNISYTQNLSNRHNRFLYETLDEEGMRDTLSNGWQNNESLENKIDGSLQAIYSHMFASKPGRRIAIDLRGGASATTTESSAFAEGRVEAIDLRQNKSSQSANYSVKFTYVEPLYRVNHFLETSIYFSENYRSNTKYQYNPDDDRQYTLLDSTYSNAFRNNYFSEYLEMNYRYLKDAIDFTVGARVNPTQTRSTTTYMNGRGGIDTLVTNWNYSPRMTLKYKLGKKEFARVVYRGWPQQPSVSQMEPVRDNSNVLSETVGNLGLTPSFRHIIRGFYSRFNQERKSSLNTGVRVNFTQNALVNNTFYDETGKVYRQTVNAREIPYDLSADLMYNTPVLKERLHFFTRTEVSYNDRLAYINRSGNAEAIRAMIEAGHLELGKRSQTDNVRAKEELSLRMTHDVVDFGVRGTCQYSYTQNSSARNTTHTLDWGVTADLVVRLPRNWTISTDLGYNDKWGYNLDGSLSEVMWNAKVDKVFRFGTFSLSAYDMLNQKKSVVETIGEDYIQYQRYNSLPTYVMLSFTYKLNRMGSLKATGHGGFMQEMIENGGKPMQGPPPFMR